MKNKKNTTMKYTFFYVILAALFVINACSGNKQEKNDGLYGKYSVDISEFEKFIKAEKNISKDDIKYKMFETAIKNADLTVEFCNDSLGLNVSKTAAVILSTIDNSLEFPAYFKYKMEGDTLYIAEENKELEKLGTLVKVGDNYDNLIFSILDRRINISVPLSRKN